MYLFAHLGLGYGMIETCPPLKRRQLPVSWILAGTIAPDVLDKSLYYIPSFITGKRGVDLGFITGTRSVGHTLLFTLAFFALAQATKSKKWLAFACGCLTHLILDQVSDLLFSTVEVSDLKNLLWPLLGWRFPPIAYPSLAAQLSFWVRPGPLAFEVAGIIVLFILARRARALKQ